MKKIANTRFEIMKDGYIKDLNTGLKWGKSSKALMNHKDAVKYCEDQKGRLPSRYELESLQDLEKHDPCIDKEIFKDTVSSYYWSSTPGAWNKNAYWCVSFIYGSVDYIGENDDNYVRPVRSSQDLTA